MKKIFLLFTILCIALMLGGCSSSGQNSTIADGSESNRQRMPDFGQPEGQADISGIVESITGNEVTILKIERPQMQERQDDSEQSGDEENDGEKAVFGSTGGGMGPGRGMGSGGGGRPEMDEDVQDQMLKRMKEMSSGKEVVLVPVGIQMLKPDEDSANSGEPNMVEASLSDISANTMIQVWLNEDAGDDDRNIANFVLIMR